jgi:hypothetical protein
VFVRICAAVVAVAVAALTSACGGAEQVVVRSTGTSSGPLAAVLDQRAKVALALPESFSSLASAVDEGSTDPGTLPMAVRGQAIGEVCGAPLWVHRGTSAAHTRTWSGAITLFERVHVTSELPARELLSKVRQRVRECGRPAGEVVPDVPFAHRVAVEESYAYCEAAGTGKNGWTCRAALAQHDVFAFVVVSGVTGETARTNLAKAVPIFAMNLTLA